MIDEKKLNEQLMNELNKLWMRLVELEAVEIARMQAEDALRVSEERFRSIAEGSFDIIFMMDYEGAFTYVSPAVKRILGYEPEEVLDKSLEDYLPDSEIPKTMHAFNQIKKSKTIEGLELLIPSKDGANVYFEINANSVTKDGDLIGFQGIARDITARKIEEEEMKKRLMKFNLEEGKLYLVQETTHTISHEAFKDMLSIGYSGLVISRTPLVDSDKNLNGNFEYFWLSENGIKNSLPPKLKKIEHKIEKLTRHKIILIDRLDYLISKYNFKKILLFVQRLRELAIITNHIIILSIDSSTLKKREVRLLEKETFEVESRYKPRLREDMFSVLKFIYGQNLVGIKPSYTDIGYEMGICKPTTRKRIRRLISIGCATENSNGRRKVVEVTERGKNIFSM